MSTKFLWFDSSFYYRSDHRRNQFIQPVSSVELLSIQSDGRLSFSSHISNICRLDFNQLNALIRFKRYLSLSAKKLLRNSYILSNFYYCYLVSIFSDTKSLDKIESLQKWTCCFFYSDYTASFEVLLLKAGKFATIISRMGSLWVEIYKTIINVNPQFMNEIFKLGEIRDWYEKDTM